MQPATMNKIILPKTWAYENFVTDEEQKVLLDFSKKVRPFFRNNGPGRFYVDHVLNNFIPPKEYHTVKQRIISVDNLTNWSLDPFFGDFISFNEEGAAIHEHKDLNEPGKVHTRYNLLLSLPTSGGNPVYDGKVIEVKERMLWRCEAGLYNHASLPVSGNKPRINISFGFQL